MDDKDKIKELTAILLNPKEGFAKERAEAARALAEYKLDINAFNALYSICSYPDMYAVRNGLVPIAGESIGKIISFRDLESDPLKHHSLDPGHFDSFHTEALAAALSFLAEEQFEKVYEHTLKNSFCSETLSTYFYELACERALKSFGNNRVEARRQAKNAIKLFGRFKKDENRLFPHFHDVVMHILAGESFMKIIPLFIKLNKSFQSFDPPRSDFEGYSHLLIKMLINLVTGNFRENQELVSEMIKMEASKRFDEGKAVEVIESILKGDGDSAASALEALLAMLEREEMTKSDRHFYLSWSAAAGWLIRQRRF